MADTPTNAEGLTFGEHIVGKSFNPSGDSKVAKAKALIAEVIDLLEVPASDSSMGSKLFDRAVFDLLAGQMMAVKYLTLPKVAPADDTTDTTSDDGGVAAPADPTEPTTPGGAAAETETPKVAPNDPSAAPAAQGAAAGTTNPNAVPQAQPRETANVA